MKQLGLSLSYLLPLITLWTLSLLILNSVHFPSAQTQLVIILIGLVLYFLISRLDYQLYLFSPWPWYVLANLALIFTLVLGTVTRGSVRWLTLFGVSLQTSEF